MKPEYLDIVNLRRIAIVRCCGLGDVAQMTPLLQQIRCDAPHTRVAVFLNAGAAPLLDGSQWVDEVHALPSSVFAATSRNLLWWSLWKTVREHGAFDAVFCLDLSWSHSLLVMMARTGRRIGFRTEGWKPWLPFSFDVTVPLDYPRNADHTSLWFLRLWLGAADLPDRGFAADLRHLEDSQAHRLPRHIALVPRAGNDLVSGALKQWPLRNWSKLAEGLLSSGWTPVILGLKGDLDMQAMPSGVVDMQGRLTVPEAARYISRCAGLIGNDSGLFHIALALGVPAIGLFGPTAVARTGPFRAPHGLALAAPLACVPCCSTSCHAAAEGRDEALRPFCLSSLAPEWVCERALEHFYKFNA